MDVLATVSSPSGGGSVVAKGQVQDLIVDEDGTARFTFLMAKDDPGSLVKDLRAKVEGVAGVTSAKVSVHLPQSAPPPPPGPGPDQGLKPGSVPAPTPKPARIEHLSASRSEWVHDCATPASPDSAQDRSEPCLKHVAVRYRPPGTSSEAAGDPRVVLGNGYRADNLGFRLAL